MTSSDDLVVFSHLRWTFVWQRPQHLISRIAKSRRTFFVEEPWASGVDEPVIAHEQHGDVTRVWLKVPGDSREIPHVPFKDEYAPLYLDYLNDVLDPGSKPIVWLYTPMAAEMAKDLSPEMLVYDVMDDLASFKHAPESLRMQESQVLQKADLVFTGGRSLYQRVHKRRPDKTFLFPSGVDQDHYASARDRESGTGAPVAGYVGVIDERLDLDLIEDLALRLPDWCIEMVGPVVKIDESSLPQAPNIRYSGQQPYEKLPEVMARFDVALMPFALNEYTKSISPTKTLEYLAAGLPVVSTPVADVVSDYGHVVDIQDDARGFAEACANVVEDSREDRDRKISPLIKFHAWDSVAVRMDDLIVHEQKEKADPEHRSVRPTRSDDEAFDFLIVGAGYAGSVLAERLATQADKKVLVIDKRSHIGGNAYDHYDDAGVLVHKYGPHIFHTNSKEVFDHLSRFTQWRQYEHRVLASVDGRLVPMPINLDTVNELYGLNLTSLELEDFFQSVAEPVDHARTSEEAVVSKVGRDLYEKFFRNYTRKQWDLDPSELDAAVAARVPARTNRDDRYFTDRYQAMPLHGYTRMFENMLDHPNIKIMLNTTFDEIRHLVPYKEIIYSGPVDEFFGFRFGKLPYRSLEFEFQTHDVATKQRAPVVNYPNEHAYTRCTEFKYLTGQEHPRTSVVYEYPTASGDPYYPIPRPENAELYKRYKALADSTQGVHFVGRLATYKY
ncbi:MAG: UDP-galactopyranose mutase, partial [Actinomycetota bacterium]|nr:UDP-galactopyranose mutase [Actinomycetota bacterium]